MEISVHKQHGQNILKLSGDLISEVDRSILREEIRSLVGKGIVDITIDLKGVRYINSSGLGALVAGLSTTRRSGGDIHLVGLQHDVSEVFRITKLDTVFKTTNQPQPVR